MYTKFLLRCVIGILILSLAELMASNSLDPLRYISPFCDICSRPYIDPHLLTCCHTFCKWCINKSVVYTDAGVAMMRCPAKYCHQITEKWVPDPRIPKAFETYEKKASESAFTHQLPGRIRSKGLKVQDVYLQEINHNSAWKILKDVVQIVYNEVTDQLWLLLQDSIVVLDADSLKLVSRGGDSPWKTPLDYSSAKDMCYCNKFIVVASTGGIYLYEPNPGLKTFGRIADGSYSALATDNCSSLLALGMTKKTKSDKGKLLLRKFRTVTLSLTGPIDSVEFEIDRTYLPREFISEYDIFCTVVKQVLYISGPGILIQVDLEDGKKLCKFSYLSTKVDKDHSPVLTVYGDDESGLLLMVNHPRRCLQLYDPLTRSMTHVKTAGKIYPKAAAVDSRRGNIWLCGRESACFYKCTVQ